MERKSTLLITLLFFQSIYLIGQNNKNIYNAYAKSNMDLWKSTIISLESKPYTTNAEKLELINYNYGYIGWCIDQKQIDEAEIFIKKTEKLILLLEESKYNPSMLCAYKSAIIGFTIGISPYKAPFIGMRSQEYAEKSIALDSTNAMGFIQLGNICYYKPKVFGGSKNEAILHYKKALHLMQTKPAQLTNSWNYLNLLATITMAYIAIEQYHLAKVYSLKALNIEPQFKWIKNELHPQILKKLSND